MTFEVQTPASRFVVSQSWWIASEICRRHEGLRIYEMHPGGGMYDVLRIFSSPTFSVFDAHPDVIDLNRAGSIHVSSNSNEPNITWLDVLASDSPHSIVKLLEDRQGWAPPAKAPATTKVAATYRLIAEVLTSRVNDRDEWDARSGYLDSSEECEVRTELLEAFPTVAAHLESKRNRIPIDRSSAAVWVLTRAGTPVLAFDEAGLCHSLRGEVFDPMVTYKATRDIHAVASQLPLG